MRSVLLSLAASLREASAAIAACDLPRLQGAVQAQEEALASVSSGQSSAIQALRDCPELAADLARSSVILSRVLASSRRTETSLSSLYQDSNEPYSLESLPRR